MYNQFSDIFIEYLSSPLLGCSVVMKFSRNEPNYIHIINGFRTLHMSIFAIGHTLNQPWIVNQSCIATLHDVQVFIIRKLVSWEMALATCLALMYADIHASLSRCRLH